jgi:Mg2+/Co2+ transporter CorC
MPRRGESVSLAGLELRVARADRRRIDSLRVAIPGMVSPSAAPAAE